MAPSTSSKPPKGLGGLQPFPPPPTDPTAKQDRNNNNNNQNNAKLGFDKGPEVQTATTTATKDQLTTEAEGDDEEGDMPKSRPQTVRREADISLILNLPQRIDLTKLNDGIMLKLEDHLAKPFNFLNHPVAQINRIKVWNYEPVVEAQKAAQASQAANTNPTTETNNGDSNTNKSGEEQGEGQEGKPRFIPTIDANSVKPVAPSMSVLKDEAGQYFIKWKTSFNKRLNDLIVPNQSGPAVGPSRQGQGGPRGAGVGTGAGAGPAGRNQQQQVNKGIAYQADLYLIRRFQPVDTPLCHLPVDKRRLLIHALILMVLSTEHYISYSRLYMLYFASSLHIPAWVLIEEENRIARGLGKIYKTLCEEAEARDLEEKRLAEELQKIEEAQKATEIRETDTADELQRTDNERPDAAQEAPKAQEAQQAQEAKPAREPKKKWRPSPNPIQVGNTLLAVGIGMIEAAQGLPAINLPPTSVTHLIGPLGDSETAVGVFFGINPNRARMSSFETLTSAVQDGAVIALHCPVRTEIRDPKDIPAEDRRMRLVICVNGLLTNKEEITSPWTCLGSQNEVLAIRWETEALEKVGGALDTLRKSKAWPEAQKALSGQPIMTTMQLQAWPDTLMRVSKIVDNAWVMALTKCVKLQQVLSDTLVGHVHGERGISLIGYGLGARAIYLCLSHLAERRQYGVVDTVVLMGAPIPGDTGTWSALKSVVSGRLVNVYSPTDFMLAFASRQTAFYFGIAGLQQIQGVGGVENHDVSDILEAHLNYTSLVPAILKRIGWEDLKQEFKAPAPLPKAPVAFAQQKAPVPTPKRSGQAVSVENKENTLPQRGGKNFRGGGRGGRNNNNNADKRLADQMGKMDL